MDFARRATGEKDPKAVAANFFEVIFHLFTYLINDAFRRLTTTTFQFCTSRLENKKIPYPHDYRSFPFPFESNSFMSVSIKFLEV